MREAYYVHIHNTSPVWCYLALQKAACNFVSLQITASLRLEKTSKITKSNHQPMTTTPTNHVPQHHICRTPETVTPSPPQGDCANPTFGKKWSLKLMKKLSGTLGGREGRQGCWASHSWWYQQTTYQTKENKSTPSVPPAIIKHLRRNSKSQIPRKHFLAAIQSTDLGAHK